MGIDNAHNFDEWEERMNIEIVSMDERDMVFDLVGVDVSIANALRRILIAEVRIVYIAGSMYARPSTRALDHRAAFAIQCPNGRERAWTVEMAGADDGDREGLYYEQHLDHPGACHAAHRDIRALGTSRADVDSWGLVRQGAQTCTHAWRHASPWTRYGHGHFKYIRQGLDASTHA